MLFRTEYAKEVWIENTMCEKENFLNMRLACCNSINSCKVFQIFVSLQYPLYSPNLKLLIFVISANYSQAFYKD